MAPAVILGFLCLRLILYLSANTVIKGLSQLPAFSFCDCVAAAHFSHASLQCQQCATCFAPNYCTADPKHSLQPASFPFTAIDTTVDRTERLVFDRAHLNAKDM